MKLYENIFFFLNQLRSAKDFEAKNPTTIFKSIVLYLIS